jgi:excisionase family DNA binding protein
VTKDTEVIGMTKGQAARALGVSISAIEQLMRSGELPYANIGQVVRFHPEDLHRFMRERTQLKGGTRTTTRIMESS